MNYSQIAILLLQGSLVSFVILLLFRLRKKLGIGTLFACLGLFQFVQVFLASTVYISITDTLIVSPGTAVLFTATLFALLIIYIKEDASEAKKIIYALVMVNIVMTILLQTFSWNLEDSSTQNPFNVSTTLFNTSAWVLLIGTIALFLDALLIIILFEYISKKIKFLFLQICLTMLLVVCFDTVFFSFMAFWGSDNLFPILTSGLISKGFFAVFYSVIFYSYLKYVDFKDDSLHLSFNIKDVFQPLTYKQKFETVKKEREKELIILNKEKEQTIEELVLSKQKIQAALKLVKENEYSLRQAGRMAKIGYWSYNKLTDVMIWSDTIHQIYGTDPKKGVPERDQVFNAFHKESIIKLKKATELLENQGVFYDLELQVTNLKNEKLWIRNIGEPIYNDKNEIIGRRGVLQDITEAKKGQLDLEFSKQEIQAALELVKENEYSLKEAGRMAKIGYWSYDKQTDTIFWSKAVHEIYGNNPKDGVPELDVILTCFSEESVKKLIEATVLLATKGISFEIELEMTNLKNEKRWILNMGEPIFNDKKEVIGRRGVSQDITQRKLIQNELDAQNEKLFELNDALNLAQKLSHVGSWRWNMTTDEAEWSDEMYNIYGVTKEHFYPSNSNVAKTVVPEDLYKVEKGVASLLVDRIFIPFEFRIQRPSGEVRTLYIMALEKDSEESVFGVTKDITEQKQIEEKNLRITEEYKELFENVTISIWNEDLSLVFEEIEVLKKRNIPNIKTYLENNPEVLFSLIEKVKVNSVNQATLKLFKAKSRKHFFNNIQTTFGEGAEKVFMILIEAIWNHKKTFTSEVKYRKLDGEEFTALLSIPIPQTIAKQKTVPVSIQNIQSIKEAELAKKESIKRLNEAQQLAKVGSWLFNISTETTEWSDETFRIWGFNLEELAPGTDAILKRIHIDDLELFNNAAYLAVNQGIPYDIEIRIYQPNQEQKTIRSICQPILDENGNVVSLRGTNQDITAQKRAMLEIAKADEMYRILTDNSNDLICLQEPDSTFKYISPSVKTLLGYEPSDFLGKKIFSIIHKEDIYGLRSVIEKRTLSRNYSEAISFRIRHKDGHYIWLEFLSSPVYKGKEISYFVTTSRDITQWVKAKEEIQEYQTSLQKMTTEMTMIEEKQKKEIASNIHDHLSQSLVISKMKINELKKNPQLKIITEDLKFIETHISEALVNSRKITYELSPPVLYQLGIVEALNWLLEEVETNHKIAYCFNSNVNNIKLTDVKSILLYRSIQEIIKNTIKYANASLITLNFDEISDGIQILIADDGVGFDTSILKNIHTHRGKGFGLFTVQERIINIKGKFTIESEINKGTSVKIFIPLAT
ncbi:PAS domain-containing protein [uncultured Polaribacter sp.]|uniref:PAS domain-containing protein n=1 Tax=uncultured Polaribacter sp. TaxID=174711 RepID=UPI0030D971DB